MTKAGALLACLALADFGVVAQPALAQDDPNKPIKLVAPYPPGGGTDLSARIMADALSTHLGQQVVVENRPGATGTIGTDFVAKATPDGYTLVWTSADSITIVPALRPTITYKIPDDLTLIGQVADTGMTFAVSSKLPVKDIKELVAYAKANPGKLSFASSGNGASSHLAGVMFNNAAGTDFMHVPYKGTGPALADLLGGQVSMTFTDVLTALPYIKSGKLRALGVTTKERSQVLPEVPTIAEQGYAGFDVSVFFGLVVPAGTPKDTIDKLNLGFAEALMQPDVRKTLLAQGLEFAPSTSPEQLGAFIQAEVPKWRAVVKSSGAEID